MGKSSSKLSADKLHVYTQETGFSDDEIKMWFKFFKNDFPEGKISNDDFAKLYRVFHPDGKPGQFAAHVFRVLDQKNKGWIDFDDFLRAHAITARGTKPFVTIPSKNY